MDLGSRWGREADVQVVVVADVVEDIDRVVTAVHGRESNCR